MAKEIKNEEAMVNEAVEVTAENTEIEVAEKNSKRNKVLNGFKKYGPLALFFGAGFWCGKKAGINAANVAEVAENVVNVANDIIEN